MVQQLFGILFGVSLVALVLAVPVGLVLLAWPRRTRTPRVVSPHGASAHA
jgi:uncharacterized membrane protein YedE/YeeE